MNSLIGTKIKNNLLKSFHNNYIKKCSSDSSLKFKSSPNYFIEEIRIPVPSANGHLAGKLWQGHKANNCDGSSAIPIICLHGVLDNCGSFDPLIPLIIKDNLKILAIDLPGHGYSYHTKDYFYDYIMGGLITIKRVLRHFGWEKVTFMSHSLGSSMSFVYSALFPQEVHKYIALEALTPISIPDPVALFQVVTKKFFEVEAKLAFDSERPTYTYADLLEKLVKSREEMVSVEGCKTLLVRGAEKVEGSDRYRFTHDVKHSALNVLKTSAGFSQEMKEAIAKEIICPVCFIKGVPGGFNEIKEHFQRTVNVLSQNNKKFEIHYVPGRHHLHLNDPHSVAPIISKFLDS